MRRLPVRPSLGVVIGSFKSAAAKRLNELRGTPGSPVWQRSYHEHILWGLNDLEAARQYVEGNPANWADDEEHTVAGGAG